MVQVARHDGAADQMEDTGVPAACRGSGRVVNRSSTSKGGADGRLFHGSLPPQPPVNENRRLPESRPALVLLTI